MPRLTELAPLGHGQGPWERSTPQEIKKAAGQIDSPLSCFFDSLRAALPLVGVAVSRGTAGAVGAAGC